MDPTRNVELFTVNRAGELEDAPGQTQNASRISGVSSRNSKASKLWFGRVHTGPGTVSAPHHHGEAETGGYVLKGSGFIRFGNRYSEIVYMEEGDFVFVPPFMPHIEGNTSLTEDLVWLTTRTPDNIVVNLDDDDVADLKISYRS